MFILSFFPFSLLIGDKIFFVQTLFMFWLLCWKGCVLFLSTFFHQLRPTVVRIFLINIKQKPQFTFIFNSFSLPNFPQSFPIFILIHNLDGLDNSPLSKWFGAEKGICHKCILEWTIELTLVQLFCEWDYWNG